MKLFILDRINLLTVIGPLKGSFALVELKMKLHGLLVISEAEQEKLEWKAEEGKVTWNNTKDEGLEIDLAPYKEVIEKGIDAFKALHEEKQDWDEVAFNTLNHVKQYAQEEQTLRSEGSNDETKINENNEESNA
jgi:hypothetical protein